VVVERRVGSRWELAGDQSGEVITTVKFPEPADAFSHFTGGQEWRWTASWEAFVGRVPFTDPQGDRQRATPAGTYRFVVRGVRRTGGADEPYSLTSAPFEVHPWDGITVAPDGLRDGRPAFRVGPGGPRKGTALREEDANGNPLALEGPVGPIDYPDSYKDALAPRFVKPARTVVRDPAAPSDASRWEWYCLDCSFRPWLDAGDASTVDVTFTDAAGTQRTVAAAPAGDGVWVASRALAAGERSHVAAGDARDAWGNHNGAASAAVG
jgi:hypothetical protein